MISLCRYGLLRGWAKYLCIFLSDIRSEVDRIEAARGTRRAIAVADDYYALLWQRLDYRRHRASYAVGMFGLTGYAGMNEDGTWREASKDELAAMNRKTMAKYRDKAVRAVKALKEAKLLPCTECEGYGYFVIGDQDYPCRRCGVQGIIKLSEFKP